MARQVLPPPTAQTQIPDVPNWSWHEYGMRVGVWRFFDMFKRLKIRPTLAINARVCEDYARVAEQAKAEAWDKPRGPSGTARLVCDFFATFLKISLAKSADLRFIECKA